VAVIEVGGELDAATAPRLAELLIPRLASTLRNVVLDLSAVTFLGVAGLSVLIHAHHQGRAHGCRLRLLTGPHCVNRALHIAGLDDEFACHPIPSAGRTEGRP
jgi:anti-sigma B factor antagonist